MLWYKLIETFDVVIKETSQSKWRSLELESESQQKTMFYSNKNEHVFFKCSVNLFNLFIYLIYFYRYENIRKPDFIQRL